VFTKCGLAFDERDPYAKPPRVGAPDAIRRECDASLRRLGVERIDLLQIHWPPEDGTPVEEAWGAVAELVDAGKIRAGGVSNFSVEQLERCAARAPVGTVQPPFSLIDRRAGGDVIPWAAAHDTGVIVYSPMGSGLLTGRFSHERAQQLEEGDWRRSSDEFNEPALSRNLALQDALRPVAERHGTTPAAVAVAWTLEWAGVSGAIVGARSPEQVDGWIGAARVQLTAADLQEIAAAAGATAKRKVAAPAAR